jgi:hypothetical protein
MLQDGLRGAAMQRIVTVLFLALFAAAIGAAQSFAGMASIALPAIIGSTDTAAKPRRRRRPLRPKDPSWNTNEEAADYLGTCVFNKMRGKGTSPRYIKRFGKIYYRRDWLDEWLEAGARTSTSEGHRAALTPRNAKIS